MYNTLIHSFIRWVPAFFFVCSEQQTTTRSCDSPLSPISPCPVQPFAQFWTTLSPSRPVCSSRRWCQTEMHSERNPLSIENGSKKSPRAIWIDLLSPSAQNVTISHPWSSNKVLIYRDRQYLHLRLRYPSVPLDKPSVVQHWQSVFSVSTTFVPARAGSPFSYPLGGVHHLSLGSRSQVDTLVTQTGKAPSDGRLRCHQCWRSLRGEVGRERCRLQWLLSERSQSLLYHPEWEFQRNSDLDWTWSVCGTASLAWVTQKVTRTEKLFTWTVYSYWVYFTLRNCIKVCKEKCTKNYIIW